MIKFEPLFTVIAIPLTLAFVVAGACGGGDSSDVGGVGGSGAGSGTASSTGSGVLDPPGPPDPDVAANAAVFIGSCVVNKVTDIPLTGINKTLTQLYSWVTPDPYYAAIKARLSCFTGKTNGCDAVEECLGIRMDLTGPCETKCTGEVLDVCSTTLHASVDCAKLGLSCSVESDDCIKEEMTLPLVCGGTPFMPECREGSPVACDGRERVGPLCSDHGLTCALNAGATEAACRGSGAACDSPSSHPLEMHFDAGLACEGGKLRACVNDGEHLLECGDLAPGFQCQVVASTSFCGLAAECEPGVIGKTIPASTCEGDSVVFCNAGRVEKIDCKGLGFTGCNADTGYCQVAF